MLIHLRQGILVVNPAANVIFYNEPVAHIAGIDAEDAMGKNIVEIFPNRDVATIGELSEKIVSLQRELFRKASSQKVYIENQAQYTLDDIIGKSAAI